MRTGIIRLLIIAILGIATIAPAFAYAISYSINIQDIEITPDNPDVGDTLDIEVSYRIEGDDTTVKLYLYVDGILEKTYSKSYSSEGTYHYTFYYDTEDLDEDEDHDIKITAKIYDDEDDLRDTDSDTETITLDSDGTSDSTYYISTKDITITPTAPYSGDTISIKAQFYVGAPSGTSVKVKSYLYVDGTLEKTYTGTYYTGTRYYTFTFDTEGLERGNHDIEIKQELYRGTTYKDTDSEEKTIYLNEERGITHDLDFTTITYETPVDSATKTPITVTVKNSGNTDEEDVRIKLILGSKTVYSLPFYIRSQSTITKTVYIETPEESGRHELIIIAYNSDVEEKSIQNIETKGYEISIKLTPEAGVYTGDWVKVSGLAREDDKATTQKISIYVDDTYEKTIMPDANGNYEDYVMFDTPGFHKVSVDLKGTTDDKIILVEEKKTTDSGTTTGTTGTTSVTIGDGQPYTVIIIKDGTERIYIEGGNDTTACEECKEDTSDETPDKYVDEEAQKKIAELEESIQEITAKIEESNDKIDATDSKIDEVDKKVDESRSTLMEKLEELKASLKQMLEDEKAEWERQRLEEQESELKYVDIETSSKELVISNYGANTLSIYITNHLGKTESFSVETDFDKDWVFLPETAIIKNKETQTLDIYFNPLDASGTYEGEITIRTSESTIKKIPLTIYVSEKETIYTSEETDKDFIGPDSIGGMILILLLFAITIAVLYMNRGTTRGKEKPLEPTMRTVLSTPEKGTTMWRDENAYSTSDDRPGRYTRAMGTFRGILKESMNTEMKPKKHKDLGKVYYVGWNNVIQ